MSDNALKCFQWCSEYSVGIAELDEDHQTLFELLNHLRAVIKSGEGSALNWVIEDIQQYTIYHFRHEEDMMRACRYQYLDNHKLVHRMLETRVGDYINNSKYKSSLKDATWFVGFFENWMKDHILGMDKNYSTCMQEDEKSEM